MRPLVLGYSMLLLTASLASSCATRHTYALERSVEQAEAHREHSDERSQEQTLLEDVVYHEEWGSESSPTTFRRVRVSRRASSLAKKHSQEKHKQEIQAESKQVVQHKESKRPKARRILWGVIGFALGICAALWLGAVRQRRG